MASRMPGGSSLVVDDGLGMDASAAPNMAGSSLRFKVLVVGPMGAGKTCIIQRYVHGMMTRDYKVTLGVDFAIKQLTWENGAQLQLQLWDIAGQERYSVMTRAFYQKAVGAL